MRTSGGRSGYAYSAPCHFVNERHWCIDVLASACLQPHRLGLYLRPVIVLVGAVAKPRIQQHTVEAAQHTKTVRG